MSTLKLEEQDPDEDLFHVLNWETALDGDTISTATWVNIPVALTKETESNTTTTHTIRISGGVAGTEYVFTSRVVTAGSETMDQRVKLRIRNG